MATVNRRYKFTGYNPDEPIIGVTNMGNVVDGLGLAVTIRRTTQYDDTLTDSSTLDNEMSKRHWVYDP